MIAQWASTFNSVVLLGLTLYLVRSKSVLRRENRDLGEGQVEIAAGSAGRAAEALVEIKRVCMETRGVCAEVRGVCAEARAFVRSRGEGSGP